MVALDHRDRGVLLAGADDLGHRLPAAGLHAVLVLRDPDVALGGAAARVGPRDHDVPVAHRVGGRLVLVVGLARDREGIQRRAAGREACADDDAVAAALLVPEQVEVRAVEDERRVSLVDAGARHRRTRSSRDWAARSARCR
jgi:hypothetical protein